MDDQSLDSNLLQITQSRVSSPLLVETQCSPGHLEVKVNSHEFSGLKLIT